MTSSLLLAGWGPRLSVAASAEHPQPSGTTEHPRAGSQPYSSTGLRQCGITHARSRVRHELAGLVHACRRAPGAFGARDPGRRRSRAPHPDRSGTGCGQQPSPRTYPDTTVPVVGLDGVGTASIWAVCSASLASPGSQTGVRPRVVAGLRSSCRFARPGALKGPSCPRPASFYHFQMRRLRSRSGPPPRERGPRIEHGLGVGMQVSARHGRVLVPGDPLQQVQFDAGVGHPGQRGVPKAVPDQARQPEVGDELVPPGSVPQRRRGEDPAAWPVTNRSSGSRPTVSRARVGRGAR
jgi:hypothetical protein